MDEAERCHEIAYIAYGVLLARGTVNEVIAASQLVTYAVSTANGKALAELAEQLSRNPAIETVAPFGANLHVSARDAAALKAVIESYRHRADLTWTRSEPSLEDVFIDLMTRAKDPLPKDYVQ